jgi:hypothetical protein
MHSCVRRAHSTPSCARREEPPIDLRSHPKTRELVDTPSPVSPRVYKQREDLLDAALCAWTAALWHRAGLDRCQGLGAHSAPDCAGLMRTA